MQDNLKSGGLLHKIKSNIVPLPEKVLVKDMDFGEKITKGGIILLDDDGKESGIHPRWAQVWKIGNKVTDLKEGDWVLIAHGRWTRTFICEENDEEFRVNLIDYPEAILIVSDEKPI